MRRLYLSPDTVSGSFMFHAVFIVVTHFAVLAPQNSRRLSGNWREVVGLHLFL